jgi:hypothetical protein
MRDAVRLFDSADCSDEADAPYTLNEPPTCDPVPVFKRSFSVLC